MLLVLSTGSHWKIVPHISVSDPEDMFRHLMSTHDAPNPFLHLRVAGTVPLSANKGANHLPVVVVLDCSYAHVCNPSVLKQALFDLSRIDILTTYTVSVSESMDRHFFAQESYL